MWQAQQAEARGCTGEGFCSVGGSVWEKAPPGCMRHSHFGLVSTLTDCRLVKHFTATLIALKGSAGNNICKMEVAYIIVI